MPVRIMLDRDRELVFRWVDVKDLGRRHVDRSGRPATLNDMIVRLGEHDLEVMTTGLLLGLRGDMRELAAKDQASYVDELVDAGLKAGTTVDDMCAAVIAAIKATGAWKDPGAGKKDPPADPQ
jgi:hypothetical protein